MSDRQKVNIPFAANRSLCNFCNPFDVFILFDACFVHRVYQKLQQRLSQRQPTDTIIDTISNIFMLIEK
jgi:hypothetical protein